MRSAGRALTILFSFFALQLSLVSGGAACVAAAARAVGSAHVGAMPGMPATAGADDHCPPAKQGSRTPAPADQHCASMIICAFALDAPTSMTLAVGAARAVSDVQGISERTPMSYVVAPELPPPRA